MRDDRETRPWSPALMPDRRARVDLLQAVLDVRPEPLPIAVIVSAWDLVGPGSPQQWLAEHAPLVDQFLRNHPARLPHAVFGVSAQGGDFSTHDGRRDADPWERAYVARPDGRARHARRADPLVPRRDAVTAYVDQLLFGYRNGHELVAGSRTLSAGAQRELLPHVDASLESEERAAT